jgi:hypothetical protein
MELMKNVNHLKATMVVGKKSFHAIFYFGLLGFPGGF